MLEHKLIEIESAIHSALARRTGDFRTGRAVTLIAVTKNHPVTAVQAAYQAGLRSFGENRVQEAKLKKEQFAEPATWHLIGQLQTNKVNQAVQLFDLIQSVDRPSLVTALAKAAEKIGKRQAVLLQLNIAGEASKSGADPADLVALAKLIASYDALELRGLMAMAPVAPETVVRQVFRAGYGYFCQLQDLALANVHIDTLSMGMSGDYPIAIEEGANMVRVGTGLFGARTYGNAGQEADKNEISG